MSDNTNKVYCEFGKMLDDLARERDVRGPYNIAKQVGHVTHYKVTGQAVSNYMYGEYFPKREFIIAFADTFGLTPQERGELAWAYAYDSRPKNEGLAIRTQKVDG